MKRVIELLILFLAISSLILTEAFPYSVRKDLDQDAYKETEIFYSADGKIEKILKDLNHDGKADTVLYFRQGYRDREEIDSDLDGRVDTWVYYYFTGAPWKVALDTNGDGKPDYWEYFQDGAIYKWEEDRNFDGKPDVITIVEKGTGKVISQWYDDDFDGIFENKSGVTMRPKQDMLPHSLAEALLKNYD